MVQILTLFAIILLNVQLNLAQSESWRNEIIESAYYAVRPVGLGRAQCNLEVCRENCHQDCTKRNSLEHHGVVVKTANGGSYLIEHPGPGELPVVRPFEDNTDGWRKERDIPVNGSPTVGEIFDMTDCGTTDRSRNYIKSGMCIGLARAVEKSLKG